VRHDREAFLLLVDQGFRDVFFVSQAQLLEEGALVGLHRLQLWRDVFVVGSR
jgi:hypothetical protein